MRGLLKLEGATVTHAGTPCDVYLGQYDNRRLAIQLVERETGEPWTKATVNVVDVPLQPDEMCVKDYAENEGMLDALTAAGLVDAVVGAADSGYVEIPIVRMSALLRAAIPKESS